MSSDAADRDEAVAPSPKPELSERWKKMLSGMEELVTVYDRDGHFAYINRLGPGATGLVGLKGSDFVQEAYRESNDALLASVFEDGESREIHSRDLMNNYWEGRLVPLIEEDGSIDFVMSISRMRPVEEEMLQEQLTGNFFREAVQAAGMGTWRWDPICNLVYLDEQALRVVGIDSRRSGAITLEECIEHIAAEFRDKVERTLRECPDGSGFKDLEFRRVLGDGTSRWLACNGRWFLGSKGERLALIGSVFDVTERKTVYDQLVQAQKLEAVGQLTAGISHNFNNILSAILPNLHLASRHVADEGVKFVRNAQLAAERASSLVAELMVVAGRKEGDDWHALDMSDVTERVIRICRTTFGGWVQLDFECDEGMPSVMGNEGQLEQVLLNLLINARDAFEEAAISCPRVKIDIEIQAAQSLTSSSVVLRVSDNGPGMDESVRARIFEPFFTTKGKGTGLGLATAYAIITEHHGSITCSSRRHHGTSFEIRLPISEAPRVDTPIVPNTAFVGGDEKVMVVDDDPLVRAVTAATLEDAGYRIIEANGGSEALQFFDENRDIDLVVLDIGMPELTGDQVLLLLREKQEDLRALVFTGLVDERVLAMKDIELLQKPAGVTELLQAVRRALDEPVSAMQQ